MGKISRYLVFAVIAGVAIIGFWVYQKYFKDPNAGRIVVSVERGDLQELIRVQGEVVPASAHNLEFEISGTVSNIYVAEGDEVRAGVPLIKLNTSELELQKKQFASLVAERAAALAKLTAGATIADIAVYQARAASAAAALEQAEKVEQLALRAVFTAIDDAVLGTTDAFYSNTGSASPQLSFTASDSSLEAPLESERYALNAVLARDAVLANTAAADLYEAAIGMQADAQRVGVFLDGNAQALNKAVSGSVSAADIQAWQAAVAAARGALNTSAAALASAEQSRSSAAAALSVAQKELAFKESPPRPEDIAAAQALVSEAEIQVSLIEDKIRKSTLSATERSRVVHVAYKKGESARPGAPAVILNGLQPEVESDISELDIARVQNGAPATMTFDALPGATYSGAVIFIDPQKIEKDTDTYYRVNFSLTNPSPATRAGMTAEVLIRVSEKKDVLKIPYYATYERNGETYVKALQNGAVLERKVTVGISDSVDREITSGLSEGEQVIIPTD